jgi:hypothetical protein
MRNAECTMQNGKSAAWFASKEQGHPKGWTPNNCGAIQRGHRKARRCLGPVQNAEWKIENRLPRWLARNREHLKGGHRTTAVQFKRSCLQAILTAELGGRVAPVGGQRIGHPKGWTPNGCGAIQEVISSSFDSGCGVSYNQP